MLDNSPKYRDKKPTDNELFRQLLQVECQDATMPQDVDPIVLDRAEGSFIWDCQGRQYTDLCAGFGALPIGHNHPEIRQQLALQPQLLTQGMGDVYPTTSKVRLLAKVVSLFAGYEKGALAVTGSGAVELALKTATLATGASGFISFVEGYHGLELGALALTARRSFKEPFAGLVAKDNIEFVAYGCSQKELAAAHHRLEEKGFGVAGILVEPLQGRGGVRKPPCGWLKSLRLFCDQKKCLLIFDEIFTGLGRTGALIASLGVQGDLLCLGKALGGGMPLSACIGSKKVFDSWPLCKGEALHTGTFFGHSLSCFVGLKTLEMIEQERLIQRSRRLGEEALGVLKKTFCHNPLVKDVRGQGLMLAIEFKEPRKAACLMPVLRKKGLIALPSGLNGEVLSLTPALNIPKDLLFSSFQVIAKSLR